MKLKTLVELVENEDAKVEYDEVELRIHVNDTNDISIMTLLGLNNIPWIYEDKDKSIMWIDLDNVEGD